MKRITSSLLALLLALSMLIGMVPAAYAAPADTIESIDSTETVDSSETEDVLDEAEEVAVYATTEGKAAKIGDNEYDTLAEAFAAAVTGDTVTLMRNVDLNGSSLRLYPSDTGVHNLTLDLARYKITSNIKGYVVAAAREGLVIKNGTIENTNTSTAKTTSAVYVTNAGTTTFENVQITSKGAGVRVQLKTGVATVNVGNGTAIDAKYGVHLANPTNTFTTKSGTEILNVNGGTITGSTWGVLAECASSSYTNASVGVNIKAGSVNSVNVNTNTATSKNDPVKLEISGGVITGNVKSNGTADEISISGGEIQGSITNNGTLTISGGTIGGSLTNGTNGAISVTGGTFTTADPSDYLADGYEFVNGQVTSSSSTTAITTSEQLIAAIAAANDGDTITLGEGEFSTYRNTSPNKSLTFVGSGEKTRWMIGNIPALDKEGEYNSDYSFDGCETITFKNMTMVNGAANYLGFVRIGNSNFENCTFEGRGSYWGYKTATFTRCTFNAPEGDYALWDYSTPSMTFDECTFNINGKGVNVYVEAGNAGSATRTVTVKDCTVISTKEDKAFLNIKNSTQAYDVTFSGTNTVNGLAANATTGSNLFQVETTKVTETSGNPVTVKETAADGTEKVIYEVKADTVPSGYVEDENGNVSISDADGLFWLAKQVNENGNTFAGKTVVLAADIDLKNAAWTPIGTSTNQFKGTFDGQNKTISNISANCPSMENVGLFGFATNCTLKNVTLENVDIKGKKNVGGLAGTVFAGSTVENVTVKGNIKISASVQYVGGIAGGYSYAKYVNCKVIGDGADSSYIQDTLVGDYTNYAGGIVGLYGEGAAGITGCEVSDITIRTVGYGAGGITGVLQYNNRVSDCKVKNVVIDSQPADSNGWAGTLAGKDYTSNGSNTSWLINNTIENTVIKVGGVEIANQYMGDDHTGTYPPHEEYEANAIIGTDVEYDESGKITAGTFITVGAKARETLESSISDSKSLSKGSDDTYNVTEKKAYVAEINGTGYETLAEAVKAAAAGDTITLLSDIVLTSAQKISKKLTLDLNGKTLDSTAYRTIQLNSGADLTVQDSGGTGKIANSYNGSTYPSTVYLNAKDTVFTLVSGTIESDPYKTSLQSVAINSEKDKACTVNIQGGSVVVPAAAKEGRAIVASTNSMTLNIKGGTITGGLHGIDAYSGSTVNITGGKVTATYVDTGVIKEAYGMRIKGTANVTINGGEIQGIKMDDDGYKLDVPNVTLVSGKVNGSFYSITKGTIVFTVDPTATITFENDTVKNFLPSTVELTRNADGTYGVTAPSLAQIGEAKYATLAEAIAAAKDGDTVTLLADCNGNGIVIPAGKFNDKGLTVDFNNHSYTVGGVLVGSTGTKSNAFQLNKDNTIIFQNGEIYGDAAVAGDELTDWTGAPAIMIQNYSNLTLDHMKVVGGEETCYTLSNNNGDTHIKASTITAGQAKGTKYTPVAFDICRFSVYNDVSVTVEDGSVINGNIAIGENSPKNGENQKATLTLTSGTVNNGSLIDDGIKNFDLITVTKSDSFEVGTPDGYVWDNNVLKQVTYVAEVDGKQYASLSDAIAAAKDGDTVKLLADTTEDVVINKNITLDLGGKTLTNAGEHTIVNNGTLTIKDSVGGGKVDNVTHGCGALVNNGTVILSGGTFERSAEKGTLEPYGNGGNSWYTIANYGTMTINNGTTVKNAGGYSSNIRNGGQDSTAKLTINGGTFDGGVNTVKNDANGVLEIKGGELKNTAQYVIMNWNQATISGGTFETAETAGAVLFSSAYGTDGTACGELTITGGTFTAAGSKLIDDAYDANNHGTVKISGGSFNRAVDPKHCDTGFIPTQNEDGTYGVKEGVYVAKVDNVKYETLQAAINAAKGGSTVRLLANVTLTETAVFPAGKTVHLNLVGHNITATGTALRINGTTDIQSTGGVGTIESTGNVAVAVGNNASLTVYSGTLKGREGAVITGTSTGAKIEIKKNATLIATDNAVIAGNGSNRDGKPNTILVKGGTFIGGIVTDGYIACGIYAPWNDNVTVSGGTFNITKGAGIVARAGTVKVTGGTFKCGDGMAEGWVGDSKNKVPNAALVFDKAANYPALTESSQILVSGGTFSTDPAANGAKLADGYVATQTDGMYKVGKAEPVAEINGVKYDTLQAAINAAQATQGGATITLLKNINTESYYTVNGDNPVTIDLAGCNITGSGISGLFYVTAKGDLTIKGEGIVTAVEDNGAAMAVWVRSPIAKVTLEGGTYTQQITNTADPHFDLIYVERGNVYVKGGTYKGFTPDWTLNCKDEHYLSKEANIEVTGGTFYGFDPSANPEGEGTTYVKTGYVSTANTDGTYGVKEGTYVAAIGEKKYATLAAAVDAAKDGDTIALIADVEQNTMLVINKDITLDLAGKKIFNTTDIWSDANGSYELLSIEAKVTITGNGTIDAKENDCYTINVKNGDLTIENGTFYGNVSVVQVEDGTLTINGGKFDLHQKWEGKNTYLINCIDDAFVAKTAEVAIYGGEFVDFDPNVSPEQKIDGKTPSFAAPGVGITKNENNTFTAQAGMAAQIVDADGSSVKAYEELSAAVTAADNQTVKLLKNADITAQGLTIATGKTVTLDLNGYTIEAANTDNGNIKVYGKLTLMDSTDTKEDGTGKGKITTKTAYASGTTDKVLIAAMGGGTFIMESGLIDAASFTDDNVNKGQFAVSVQNDTGDATVIINGGHIKAGWYAVAGNGTNTTYNGDITVNGGILESTADYAIYHPHTGTTTINGGTIYGAAGGVSLNRGKLVVNGGTITSKGTGSTGDWGDGTGKQDAAAINVNAQYDSTSVEIKGGTIIAENDAILLTNGRNGTIAVSGGQFSHEVKAEYCAIGYQPKTTQDPNTKLYTVEKVNGNAYYVDDSGKPVYGNFVDLVNYTNDATVNKTITLLDNVTVNGYMLLFEGRSVDLSGFELTITKKLIANDGSVSDSSDGKGLLKIAADSATLVSNNGQIPLYDTENQGYRLFNCTIKDALQTISNTSVKLWVGAIFTNKDAYKLLRTGNEHNIKIVVTLRWKNSQDTAGEQTFAFTQSLINKVALTNGEDAFYIVLTGLDTDLTGSISGVTAQGGITSGTGVSISGEEYTLTK